MQAIGLWETSSFTITIRYMIIQIRKSDSFKQKESQQLMAGAEKKFTFDDKNEKIFKKH